MDVEKTIELILESQLRAERRADKADQRADRAAQRADRADQRMDRFDKQLRATAALVKAGMKMVVRIRQEQRESRKEIRELQKEWEYKYNALIDSQMRTDELVRKNEQAIAKHDEKFNRLLEILSRRHRNGDR
jgi:hypothetical protein